MPAPGTKKIIIDGRETYAPAEDVDLAEAIAVGLALQEDVARAKAKLDEHKAATLANTTLGIRVTWSNGYKTIFNAYVSGGQGFEASQNAVVTANISFTPVGQLIEFTS